MVGVVFYGVFRAVGFAFSAADTELRIHGRELVSCLADGVDGAVLDERARMVLRAKGGVNDIHDGK